jgi:hypothetical protein
MEEQHSDDPMPVFSFLGNAASIRAIAVLDHDTNERTHDIIRSGLDRSPMYTGVIEGVGPRYCPSIEDKIHRFADKDSHNVFLEPEGLTTHEIYPNGVSTSLPSTSSWPWCARSVAWRTATSCVPATPSNTTSTIRAASRTRWRRKPSWPVLRRPDQRHDRLRRSRRAGPARRRQCVRYVRRIEPAGARSVTRPTSAYWSTT